MAQKLAKFMKSVSGVSSKLAEVLLSKILSVIVRLSVEIHPPLFWGQPAVFSPHPILLSAGLTLVMEFSTMSIERKIKFKLALLLQVSIIYILYFVIFTIKNL